MKMKQLLRHTSTLLRTVILFGVFSFVNTQSKAQTAEQWAAMPDAFETMDPASIIGDGNYYYIQFYTPTHDKCSYLTDRGENKLAAVMDFLPYANNRLWTLERVNGNYFKLKSKAGYYIGFDRLEGATGNRYVSITNSGAATTFTFQNARNNDGYNIVDSVHGYNNGQPPSLLGRYNNLEWLTGLSTINNDNTGKDNSRMRFAKLKSNAAFIIYYRDGGAENSDPSASTIRHYLTYSDVDAESTVMASAVTNGSLEGADASSFFFGDPDHDDPFVASITDGAGNNGSRGIQIEARGKADPQDWDTQFFIRANEVIPEGTTFHLEFDYKASRNATVPTQAHAEPGNYIDWAMLGDLNFTTTWQTYSADIEVSHVMGYGRDDDKGNSFQTIAFNLWRDRSTDPNTIYYFDNIKLTVPTSGSAVSSRRSIIPPDKPLSTLPTIAAYHQDGLWQLEEASADGKFYIKKYDSNEYLNCDLADPYAAAFAVLGPKDETHGQYSLVDPVASRYTLVQNVQYQTAALSPDMFYHWNGYGADASIDGQHGDVDFNYQLGTQLGSGGTVVGTGGVDYVRYADLTNYTTMIVKGTPGMVVRVLMNRQESNSGPYTLRELTIGNDGKVELDLTDIKNDAGYVHLNAIKIGWGNSGIINDVELVNQNQVNTSSPLYLNHSNGDGYPVMQRNDDAANHWYAAFYPVEVPVPNKDDFFQVLVKWGANMIDHNGGASALPTDESDYDLWQLEMVDDYKHFRLKDPNGRYLKPGGTGVTEPNNPEGAETNTNEKFWTDFALTWFFVNPVSKEIRVDKYVTHRLSYLKQYAEHYSNLDLDRQGLVTGADSEWKVSSSNYLDGFSQKVNHFEITHYIKRGDTKVIEFPTVLNRNNDHIYFQRFYNYDEADDNMNLDNLKAHVSLDTRDDGDVQYFLYKNGMVTGDKLDWTGIDDGGFARYALRRFNFTNSDGQRFTVAADVSRYSDFTYYLEKDDDNKPIEIANADPIGCYLEEPSLTMRYIYYMRDAKEMAQSLTAMTFQGFDFIDSKEGLNFLEAKTFHFPMKQIFYEKQKKVGYRGEFIGVRHLFSDYWVFDGNGTDDSNLVSAVNNASEGKIEVKIYDPHNTGIRLGGWNPTLAAANGGNLKFVDNVDKYDDDTEADFRGFYFYDKMSDGNKTQYGDSRFVVFRYPDDGQAHATGPNNPVYINVYLNNNGTRYQLAQFTIIFDAGTVTLPYTSVNGSDYVKDDGNNTNYVDRDPHNLIKEAGAPIAKVTFDYPAGDTYHFPDKGQAKIGWVTGNPGGTMANSSPIPLTFGNTNYAFNGFECNWGSYAMVSRMTTNYGNQIPALPANDNGDYGYGEVGVPSLQADAGLQKGFLYIDASEQPGDICSAPFVGDFCAGDKLMFSGWITGSNTAGGGDNRCPGGITLTVKGEHNKHDSNGRIIYDEYGNPVKEIVTLYRFCPGQIYELDNGTGADGRTDASQVIWQQFYFEFVATDKYDRHWIEVNNNCVSSQGGDFMLDNITVYAVVPEVLPDVNTPLCIEVDNNGNIVKDMDLLKLSVNFNKLKKSIGLNDNTGKSELGFAFLEKETFLRTFRTEMQQYLTENPEKRHELGLESFNFATITLDELATAIEEGELSLVNGDNPAYSTAFDAAIIGEKKTWYSNNPEVNKNNPSLMYFEWAHNFSAMPTYSFASAVRKESAVYGETNENGEQFIVMNGNFPQLDWKADIDYYIIISNDKITGTVSQFEVFNLCSPCCKSKTFRIEPPYNILGLEKSEATGDYVVCEGQIPTMLLDLKGFDFNGNEVPMQDLNFDWWLGDANYTETVTETDENENTTVITTHPKLATIQNYHNQSKTVGGTTIRLDKALATLRVYYPDITDLDGLKPKGGENPLTQDMIDYLDELVKAGELVLHQKSISVPSEPASTDDPYFYLVACPIHDEKFAQALNPAAHEYVAFYCDEPQGLRIKVGEKAPTLKTGFVPNENGFISYDYSAAKDAILSIRLAKKEQFETVQHGTTSEAPVEATSSNAETTHYLWLPIRNAMTQTADGVIRKADDYNVYLASTNDPTWDKNIYTAMKNGLLPIVGKIVQLNAINTYSGIDTETGQVNYKNLDQQNNENRLCIYFTENFDVREGYNYTLSLPFQEEFDSEGNKLNTCDGTILINLKIVPDYEVWTGAAGNTDWNNDENWRRADGNLTSSTTESPDGSKRNNNELYRTNDLPATSPLSEYMTNFENYRTPKDRIFRKGFAPLYCTHILLKSNEWGDAPVLYDALDTESGKTALAASPFPNLRDYDGWDGTTGDDITKATATPILRYDMQARLYDIWTDTYSEAPNKGRSGDLIAEMYQVNSCDEIAFQPTAELLNAHLLNYNNAWVEYQLDNKRWYLLGSPLQGTISGEWYAPTGTAQQKTTYYENVTFGEGYDRYSPAIYQRSWDKAKAVLYEIGSTYSTTDDDQSQNLGDEWGGEWSGTTWQDPTGEADGSGADEYLDRLGYKPMGGNKANVAIKGIWSNTYNDAQVDYATGGFSVMVMNHLKGNDSSAGKSIIRLPKEDTMYDYYGFDRDGGDDVDEYEDIGTNTQLSDVRTKNRAKNRGRLKTDQLLPANVEGMQPYQKIQRTETEASRYGDARTYTRVPTRVGANALPMTLQPFTENVSAGISNLGYYLVENPFPTGLDMDEFFAANTGLEAKYWLLTSDGQHLVQRAANGEWITPNGRSVEYEGPNNTTLTLYPDGVLAPGQGFFVQATTAGEATEISFTHEMQAQTRYGEPDEGEEFKIVVGTRQVMETVGVTYDHDNNPDTAEEPLMWDDDDNPNTPEIQVTIEVPKVDTNGNFVVEDITETVTVYKYKQKTGEGYVYPMKARTTRGEVPNRLPGLVITAQRNSDRSNALVMKHEGASNDFLPSEDTETFITSDFESVPTVYTLCGRLATTINSIHDFSCLPVGVESNSDAPCTLTFKGVEMLGDSIGFYDAVEQKLTPLESGMKFVVSGQTQNRYYLVRSLIKEEAAAETHIQIFTEGLTAKVIASTGEPITNVRCYDTAGRLIHSASPQTPEYSFSLPIAGIYIIDAETENDRKTKKVMTK
jgi:hypothetical protein